MRPNTPHEILSRRATPPVRRGFWFGLLALLVSSVAQAAERVDYNFDVKPILSRRCFPCHGFDPSNRQAKLRLDTFEDATASRRRGAAIVPGDPDASRLIVRVAATADRMPPSEQPALSAAEIATLRAWIEQGAEYATHWSWQPLAATTPPAANDDWCLDDVDRYLDARRHRAGLQPVADADRATWLRRVTLDLIGLPPSPEEIDAFLADDTAKAHERVVDRLLASPHFGERWGRHWLDLVRYAETYGHEFDYPIPHAYQYRDYVIRAFNADVPYDDFVTEHLAGDLLDEPRRHPTEGFDESIIGTGFWFLHQGTHAPVDVRQDELERIDNQIDVMTKAFLGTTVACARCHDHKFDAIPTADYYGLMAFLQSSRQREVALYPKEAEEVFAALRASYAEGRTALRTVDPASVGATVERSLLATHAAVFGPSYQPYEPQPTIVFEDFETLDYGDWVREGTAFGDKPQTLTSLGSWQKVTRHHGDGFVNSHRADGPGGARAADQHVGRLTSREFTIERPRIAFMISGGDFAKRTCLDLVIDDRVVRSATGHRSNEMRRRTFDVREFMGRTAHLVIVDQERGGWGHIGVDDIVFEDVAPPLAARRDLSLVAADHDVPATFIERWIDLWNSKALRSSEHPLHPWYHAVVRAGAEGGRQFPSGADEWTPKPTEQKQPPRSSRTFEDFEDGADGWFASGEAFASGPTRVGAWREVDGRVHFEPSGVAHSATVSRRLQGSLRSPTFTIQSPRIQYRLAGQARIRLIVEGYTLDRFNALLFNGMILDVDTGSDYEWVEQAGDIENFIGHRAYLEITDAGDRGIAVDEIRFADAPLTTVPSKRPSGLAHVDDAAGLASYYGARVTAALAGWRTGQLSPGDRALLGVLSDRELLALPTAMHSVVARRHEWEASIPSPRHVLAIDDGTPEDQPIYVRGNHRTLGETVERRFLTALTDEQAASEAVSGRLELARRLLSPRNPLPARVMVNRVWHHLFGRGLVATTDDFGALGTPPTHPQLLDALAIWFRGEADWSIKRLIRRLVLTRTYRMASHGVSPKSRTIDPDNDLLSTMRAKRLEGETLRDAILAVSGRLDRRQFGPPVPLHLTPFLTGRGRPGRSGPLDGDGRRSIYLEVRRNFMSPLMAAFDAPVPMTTIGCRTQSNVPAQALILLNDPFVAAEARRWAELALTDDPAPPNREIIRRLIVRALGRSPTETEVAHCLNFLETQAAFLGTDPSKRASRVELWAELTHVIFNLKDFVFVH